MTFVERSVNDLLAAFRSPEPTPGGGSAAALAGAIGASLLAMVAGLPKSKAATEEDAARLNAAGERCAELAQMLAALVDRDSEAYDLVMAAYKKPKGTDEEKAARSAAIQAAHARRDCGAARRHARLRRRRRAGRRRSPALGNPSASSDVPGRLRAARRGAARREAERRDQSGQRQGRRATSRRCARKSRNSSARSSTKQRGRVELRPVLAPTDSGRRVVEVEAARRSRATPAPCTAYATLITTVSPTPGTTLARDLDEIGIERDLVLGRQLHHLAPRCISSGLPAREQRQLAHRVLELLVVEEDHPDADAGIGQQQEDDEADDAS